MSAGNSQDEIEQLSRLSKLRADGAITEGEFTSLKAKLLDSQTCPAERAASSLGNSTASATTGADSSEDSNSGFAPYGKSGTGKRPNFAGRAIGAVAAMLAIGVVVAVAHKPVGDHSLVTSNSGVVQPAEDSKLEEVSAVWRTDDNMTIIVKLNGDDKFLVVNHKKLPLSIVGVDDADNVINVLIPIDGIAADKITTIRENWDAQGKAFTLSINWSYGGQTDLGFIRRITPGDLPPPAAVQASANAQSTPTPTSPSEQFDWKQFAGKSPGAMFRDAEAQRRLEPLLGPLYRTFANDLEDSKGVQVEAHDDWFLTGYGCAKIDCDHNQSLFVLDMRTGSLFAALDVQGTTKILAGKDMVLPGDINDQVKAWINAPE